MIVALCGHETSALFFVVQGNHARLLLCDSLALQRGHVLSSFNGILLSKTLVVEITGVSFRLLVFTVMRCVFSL